MALRVERKKRLLGDWRRPCHVNCGFKTEVIDVVVRARGGLARQINPLRHIMARNSVSPSPRRTPSRNRAAPKRLGDNDGFDSKKANAFASPAPAKTAKAVEARQGSMTSRASSSPPEEYRKSSALPTSSFSLPRSTPSTTRCRCPTCR